ncbi:LysM peptidoglycan-binding domain-containing protein [Caldibacillus sp. 210928-DFI.2.22]|uniref:LysM peptidoglycan-binding domain-containing protein n=1 Tax=unclassified Caldibacillus TaxID=2641266 RepID=UPI001D06BDB3|nr:MULTISPECIES: LysM peptidoglycan-binding domain-containing protein [unclassified Caldibacillus]MCB7069996.1 LysM peptidoglycan-binding domain-containing protein [Caldibacillus sp. 210928-DFI.2.22]
MTDNNQPAAIKFSLDETVWFRKGEEIGELYNLALEPNVTIQDLNHFISIRGSLKMYGEYKKSEAEINDEEDRIYFSGQKYVTVLDAREEGISEFHFDFPVDITVPREKVSSIEDLDVLIEFFDYSIPEKDCLKLSTNVAITGIAADASAYERKDILSSSEEGIPALSEDPLADKDQLFPVSNDFFIDKIDDDSTFSVEAKKVEDRDEEPEENIQIPIQFTSTMDKLEKIEKKRVEADQATLSTNTNEKQFEPDHLLVESGGLENEPEASHIIEETENIPEAGRIEEELGNVPEAGRIEEELGNVPEAGRQKAEPEKLEKKPEISPWLKDSEHVPEVGPLLTNSSPKDNDRNTDPVLNDLDNENQVAVERNETKAVNTEAKLENEIEVSGELSKRDNEPVEEPKTRADLNQQIETVAVETSVQESAEQQDFADITIEEVQAEEDHEAHRTEKNINYQPQETNQDEKSISLTEFFGRKDENPAVRMKIYIVQARDTLSLIAEKYDVSVSQLLRTNHLESNQDVYEGQILYIPTNTHKIHSS